MSDALSLLAAPLIDAAAAASARPELDAVLERPADPDHGDYATTLALRLAQAAAARRRARSRRSSRPPRERATWIASADVAGPGFVNLRVSPAWYAEAVRSGARAGLRRRHRRAAAARQRRVRLGQPDRAAAGRRPGRNAAYGDSLARLFAFAGPRRHARVLLQRLRPPDRALRPLAARPRARRGRARGRLSGRVLIALAKADRALARRHRRGVRARRRGADVRGHPRRRSSASACDMDVYTNEVDLHALGRRRARARAAQAAGHLFEQDGATWLRASEFGDDKDRVAASSPTARHVPRRRPRLPRRQARARLRPRDLRARRRPPRLRRRG